MKFLRIIAALASVSICAHSAIFFGGSGSNGGNADHANNIDNGAGTNVFLSGAFNGSANGLSVPMLDGFETKNYLTNLSLIYGRSSAVLYDGGFSLLYPNSVFFGLGYGEGAKLADASCLYYPNDGGANGGWPFAQIQSGTTTLRYPRGDVWFDGNTLFTPGGFPIADLDNVYFVTNGQRIDALTANKFITTAGASVSTYSSDRAVFYNATSSGGVAIGTGYGPNDPCIFGENGSDNVGTGATFHIGTDTGGKGDLNFPSGLLYSGSDFILPDSNNSGGTTIGLKASDNGQQMYLHVTSSGVITVTTSP